jgi:hypothetical protein
MGKKSGSVSGMNIPDHISLCVETNFLVKILQFFDANPGSGMRDGKNLDRGSVMGKSQIRDQEKLPGSATLKRIRIKNRSTSRHALL